MGNAWVAYKMESGLSFLLAGMGAHLEKECILGATKESPVLC